MRQRPSSRLLVIDPQLQVLLFRFAFSSGALQGQSYWATPGGGLEANETFEDAAIRELLEETGIKIDDPGSQIAQRQFDLQLPDGEIVQADERYFLIKVANNTLSSDGWTTHETECMVDHRWWSIDELAQTTEVFWPENLEHLLSANILD